MQTPNPDSHYLKFVKFASYTARRLQRAGHDALAKDVLRSRDAVRAAGRAWEDSDDAVQTAYADRDAADDGLDLLAQTARTTLAGRAIDAPTTEPYTLVFPSGIDYYTIAPVDEEVSRYEELVARLKKHLPASDAVRKSTVAPLEKGIAAYGESSKSLRKALEAQALAGTELERAIKHFVRQVEKVYGAMITAEGKSAAERYFPKTRTAKGPRNAKGGPAPAPEPDPER